MAERKGGLRVKRRIAILSTVAAVVAVTAGIAFATVPSGNIIRAEGTETFERDAQIQSTFRWSPEAITVPTGSFIQLENKVAEPHTISIVLRTQRPNSVAEVFQCQVCGSIFAHLGNNNHYDPGGDGGLNQPLDTWVVKPFGVQKVKVTAPAGTTLFYICAIHPWMQGIINVTS